MTDHHFCGKVSLGMDSAATDTMFRASMTTTTKGKKNMKKSAFFAGAAVCASIIMTGCSADSDGEFKGAAADLNNAANECAIDNDDMFVDWDLEANVYLVVSISEESDGYLSKIGCMKNSLGFEGDPESDGETVTFGDTNSTLVNGEISWVKYEASYDSEMNIFTAPYSG